MLNDLVSQNFLGLGQLEAIAFFIPKVFFATVCGFAVGLERQLKSRPAGIRTAILVCTGSALFAATAVLLSRDLFTQGYHTQAPVVPVVTDPGRIIAQIVSGVGFIGAGVIFKLKDRVAGITTAAFIWAICAIGIMIGLGGYLISLVLTAGLITCLLLIEKLENKPFFIALVKSREDAYHSRKERPRRRKKPLIGNDEGKSGAA